MPRREGENMAVLDRPATSENGTDAADEAQETAQAVVRRVRRDPDQLGDEEIVSINLRLPNALRKQLATTAEEQNTSVPQLILSMLASAYNFTLPTPTRAPRVRQYANKEERIAAQKAAQQHKRLVTRAILDAIEAGKIDLDIDALVADLQAKGAATEGAS